MPELSLFDGAEQQKEKLAQHERHLRKLGARLRRNAAISGKAGRKPEPDTLELYQSHFVEGKPWKVCFEELWSKPKRSYTSAGAHPLPDVPKRTVAASS
jgi:hypothetical protein